MKRNESLESSNRRVGSKISRRLREQQKEKDVPQPKCICGKNVAFHSSLLDQGFCSDRCYEQAQLVGKSIEDAHIIRTRDGKAYFIQGDLRFSVNADDLNDVVGCNRGHNVIDGLMDSQVVMLASANALAHDPYVRDLLRPVLTGIVQLVWYRDIQKHESDHLRMNQARRVIEYHAKLHSYEFPVKENENGTERKQGAVVRRAGPDKWARSFKFVKVIKCQGRADQVLKVMHGLKQASFAQIVEAAKGKVETKQELDKIVDRFLRELAADGAIEEVRNG